VVWAEAAGDMTTAETRARRVRDRNGFMRLDSPNDWVRRMAGCHPGRSAHCSRFDRW
jgi:hypothetical protein